VKKSHPSISRPNATDTRLRKFPSSHPNRYALMGRACVMPARVRTSCVRYGILVGSAVVEVHMIPGPAACSSLVR
jgi:hypothetical protein